MGTVGYLLDTHTFLWLLRESPKLSDNARKVMSDPNTTKYVSAVSAYEIMYKHNIGKLPEFEDIAKNYFSLLRDCGAEELPITTQHAHFAGCLDWEHRDPFDRLLAAQAKLENMTLITNDPMISALDWVKVIW